MEATLTLYTKLHPNDLHQRDTEGQISDSIHPNDHQETLGCGV